MSGSIIIPEIRQWGEIRQLIDSLQVQWRVDREKTQAVYRVENIRFVHDPNWRSNTMSIQAAHDQDQIIWRVASTLFWSAQVAAAGAWVVL